MTRPSAPGLKYRKRKTGDAVPYWIADANAVKAGYPVKSVNLTGLEGPRLIERAQRLQAEMDRWVAGQRNSTPRYEGTFKSLFNVYQTDPESPYRTSLKPGTMRVYDTYIRKLISHIGELRIDHADGRDVRRWFTQWRQAETDQLGAARMAVAVLKAALTFGVQCRSPGCAEFKLILADMKFETLRRRTHAPTAAQIIAVRKAAHAHGAPLRALCYALQFETTLRQTDIIGQWLPLSDTKASAVIDSGRKWVGLTWAAIDGDMILAKVKPTKTEHTTEVEVSFDLSVCPMVQEELALIPLEARTGPMILNRYTGRPYLTQSWTAGWNKDFAAAGLPEGMWNRDFRAGGVTEGGKAGATIDDRRQLAGHTDANTTRIYDRDTVEAHRRVMASRKAFREGEK